MEKNKEFEKTIINYYELPTNDENLWSTISKYLSAKIANIEDLAITINTLTQICRNGEKAHKKLENLEEAISQMSVQFKDFDFYGKILPDIQKSCLQMPELFKENTQKLPLLLSGSENTVKFSGQQIKCLLSHAFFNTLSTIFQQCSALKPSKTSFGDLSFYRLYSGCSCYGHEISIERLKCQLFYFYETCKEFPKEGVVFLRKTLQEHQIPDWSKDETLIENDVFVTHQVRIEESDAFLHMDFANKNLMVHCIFDSMTQEEILFSLRPSLFVCMLLSETMAVNEGIFMFGCKRYCDYRGYLENFRFSGPYQEISNEKTISGVIALDSVVSFPYSTQFSLKNLQRDLNKLFLGFGGVEKEIQEIKKSQEISLDFDKISTGNWGCGAFGGDYLLKFVQQIMAAQATKKKLSYSTFGNENQCTKLRVLYEKIKEKKIRVKDLYQILADFNENQEKDFHIYLKKMIFQN